MNDLTPGTALAPFELAAPELVYTSTKVADDLVSKIKAAVEAEPFDLETKSGRKAVRSLAYKVAQTKVAIDKAGTALTERQRAEIAAVNAERKRVVDQLAEIQADVLKPVEEYEAREEARIAALELKLEIFDLGRVTQHSPSSTIREVIAELEATDTTTGFDEYADNAATRRKAALDLFALHLTAAETREAQEAELAEFRAQKAKADQEAADRQAALDRERAALEAERAALERDKAAAAKAEADRVAAAEKAEADRIAAEKAAAEKVEAEKRAAQEAAADKEARAKLKAKIIREVASDIAPMLKNDPKQIAEAIVTGALRHVSVEALK